jgi:hypothetical protein
MPHNPPVLSSGTFSANGDLHGKIIDKLRITGAYRLTGRTTIE